MRITTLKTAFNMFLDNLEQDYNNHIYLKRAISKILPLVIKSGGILEVVSCSKCIIIIFGLFNIDDDVDNYFVNCSHILYTKKYNTLVIDIV